MASCNDVARYILDKTGELIALKLQKLVYYAQAWTLAWDDEPLFPERIEAWANGPVCRSLYASHRQQYSVIAKQIHGDPEKLTDRQKSNIDSVLEFYGDKDAYYLRELTHLEEPWRRAREGLADGEPSENEITHESMKVYYSSL